MIRLGYSCSNLTLRRAPRVLRPVASHTPELPDVQALLDENLDLLLKTLRWNREQEIQVYRLSPYLVPLHLPDGVEREALNFARVREIAEIAPNMRLSMHPGQSISFSTEGDSWQRSYRDLCGHAFVLEQLGIPQGDLVLHAGNVPGERAMIATRMIEHINTLPPPVRQHLRLENDERYWSVRDLLPICEATGTPLIVDILHHQLNGLERWQDLPWARILATWQERRPKLHYSEQDPAKQAGAHSAYLNADRFRQFVAGISFSEYDVMLECKGKELALLKLRAELQ